MHDEPRRELLATAEQLAQLGSWQWNLRTGAIHWSDQLFRLYGLAPGARAIDLDFLFENMHPDDRAAVLRIVEQAVRDHAPFEFDLRLVRPDGTERILHTRGLVVVDEAGEAVELQGMAQDVTDRLAAAEAARRLAEEHAARRAAEQAHERLAAILDGVGEIFIATDPEWRFTFLNEKAESYLGAIGLTRADVLGRVVWEVLPGLDRSAVYGEAMRVAREGGSAEVEEYYPAFDRWFVARVARTREGFASYTRDVTVRKRAEARARESHELLRAVVDATSDSIYVKDLDGRYLLVNAVAARAMGLPADAIVGRDDRELFPAALAELYRRHDAQVLAAGVTRTFEEPGGTDANSRTLLATKGVIRDASGRPAGVVGISRDITKRKRAEAALRASEERFRTLVQSIDDVVFELDRDGRLVHISGRWLAREGLDPAGLVGRRVGELLGAAAGRAHAEHFRRALAGEAAVYEWALPLPGGVRLMQVSLGPLTGARGRVAGVVGVAREVTEQRRAERRERVMAEAGAVLSASLDVEATLERLARLAVERLCDLCVVDLLDESGEIRRVAATHRDPARQPLAERLRRYAPARGSSATARRVIESGRTEVVAEIDEARVRGMAVDAAHLDTLRRLGLRSSVVVPLVARGRTLGAVSFVATGRTRAPAAEDLALAEELAARAALAVDNAQLYRDVERQLRQRIDAEAELQRWAQIFEHAGWGVLIVSGDGSLVEAANPAFAQMHGSPVAQLVGRPLAAVVAEGSRAAVAEQLAAARRTGRVDFEAELLRLDGTAFPAQVDLAAFTEAADGPVYFAMNVQDLTAQRRAEEQVRQAQKMEALGRLAGGVAHDFNNMLMIILGFSDFLLGSLEREDPRWADADEIRKAAERASALTRQLLTFGHRQPLPTHTLDLNEVIGDMERMLRPLGGERVQLVTHLAPALGGVEADRGQLEQVVMNLALNARDAMPEGGRLTIETRDVTFGEGQGLRTVGIDLPAGEYVLLAVSDTGVGMDAETRRHIFEPFFTTKPTSQNSGLGLATVYGIVTQFGGYVWVDSAPGQGTSFKLCFPRAARRAPAADAAARDAPRGGHEVVLVVEDEESVRTLASRVLAEQGYRVREAANGREALVVLEALAGTDDQVALVLTDVVMPELGGRELAAKVAERHPATRLLFMSGYTDNEALRRGLDHAGARFLHKPFSPDSLAHKVREVLDGEPDAVEV
ncbi:MAG TPA: PAS domain S-box protein [Gemmatimonadales bacterium]|nr:PAS domain S-box protein [Gemmatimonadales bacterium]